MNEIEFKDEAQLKEIILATCKQCGLTDILSIDLKFHALRTPNWHILRVTMRPGSTTTGSQVLNHPDVKKLGEKYMLKPPAPSR